MEKIKYLTSRQICNKIDLQEKIKFVEKATNHKGFDKMPFAWRCAKLENLRTLENRLKRYV